MDESTTLSLKCQSCERVLPVTQEHFYIRTKKVSDCKNKLCKRCENRVYTLRKKERRERGPQEPPTPPPPPCPPPLGSAWLPLVGKVGWGHYALVDEADWQAVNGRRWTMHPLGYITTRMDGRSVALHRMLLNPDQGQVVDHVNGDPKDNRRSNLRTCTQPENARNTRKRKGNNPYKGIKSERKTQGRWSAKIRANGVEVYLGCFGSAEEAARAYDEAALIYHGEFARLNFPKQSNSDAREA